MVLGVVSDETKVNADGTAESAGPVIVVTGASSGIGYASSKVLAASGFRVIATARRESKLKQLISEIEEAGGTAAYFRQDVTDDEDMAKLLAFGDDKFGGIDHFFLNAGVEGSNATPLHDQKYSNIDWVLDVNLKAVFHGYRDAAKYFLSKGTDETRDNSIVLCSSYTGSMSKVYYMGFGNGGAPYVATKAAVDMLTRTGIVYAPKGIRVYNLKPNFYYSEMVSRTALKYMGDDSQAGMDAFAAYNNFFKKTAGDPVHIGHMVAAFASGATKYAPGTNVICDNDATFPGQLFNKYADAEEPPVPTDRLFGLEELRGYDGGPYECKDKRTCAYIEEVKAELAEKA